MARQEHTGICHICGEYKKLTYEHIPPEAAFNSQRRKMSTVKELMENKEKIMQMNDWLFELYKDAVTETFLNQLIDGSFDKDMIIGVEANGEDTV